MIYFKVNFLQVLIALLALFSLTTSYFIPFIYKLKMREQVKLPKVYDNLFAPSEISDIDLDIIGTKSVNSQPKHKLQHNYFGDDAKPETKEKQPAESRLLKTLNIVGIGASMLLILLFYVLVGYNLYNTFADFK